MSFLTDVEAQAKQESERVIKELTQLKFDAQQVIHVLNSLKLEVPKELRELSPIEVVPAPLVSIPSTTPAQDKKRNKGLEIGIKTRQAYAAKREEEIRKAITDQLSKGPVLRDKLMGALPYPKGTLNKIGTRMKKEGLLDYRTIGFQGPTEWFLPPRPITLETLRDEVVKTEGKIDAHSLRERFGFSRMEHLLLMLHDLTDIGVLTPKMGAYYYEKPKGTKFGTVETVTAPYRRTKNFGGGVNGVSGDKISSNKEVRELVAKIKHQGAVVNKASNHISVSYAGHTAIIGKTPSTSGLKQDRNRLKMMGLRV